MFPKSFLYNSVEVRIVPDERFTETAFYVSRDARYGIRVYKDGRKLLINPCTTNTPGTKGKNGRRKQRYLYFRDAWNAHAGVQAAHAAYRAWRERPIPPGMTIDHINGCTTDNRFENLRCVSNDINNRDGGFLRKLRHKGIDPTTIQRWMLLRFYTRMAQYKETHSRYKYEHLSLTDLKHILYDNDF